MPGWFAATGKAFDQPRGRYNVAAHIDLCELLTNFGSTRFHGGLSLAANLLGKPGKMDVHGDMVQDMYDAGRLAEIHDYCRCDVLDTYFVFLRSRVLVGQLTLQAEQEIIAETKAWLEQKAGGGRRIVAISIIGATGRTPGRKAAPRHKGGRVALALPVFRRVDLSVPQRGGTYLPVGDVRETASGLPALRQ